MMLIGLEDRATEAPYLQVLLAVRDSQRELARPGVKRGALNVLSHPAYDIGKIFPAAQNLVFIL